MSTLLRDLRHATGSLNKARRFAVLITATLALAFAANTLVFTLLNSVLLRPLPYPGASSLVVLRWKDSTGHLSRDAFAGAFFALRQHSNPLSSITATYPVDVGVNLADVGVRRYVRALRVSREFFRTLGTVPIAGRDFSPEEDQPNGPRVAILSFTLWQSAFHGAHDVVGRTLKINGENCAVIGIAPPDFWSYPKADLWIPLQIAPATADTGRDYRLIARLQAGLTVAQGQQELNEIAIDQQFLPPTSGKGVLVFQGLQEFQTGNIRQSLVMLFGAVFLVLLIACINAAMLFLVRTSTRGNEIAMRLALGSSRLRLLRLFVMESAVLMLVSGILGLILAKEMLPIVLTLAPSDLPTGAPTHIDGWVVAFVALIFILTTLLLGITPALRFIRTNVMEKLKQDSARHGTSVGQNRTLQILVCLQTALTLVLLTGAVSLLKSFQDLQRIPPGFDPNEVAVSQFSLAKPGYLTGAGNARVVKSVLDSLQRFPGIESVGSVNGLPLETGLNLPIYPTEAPQNVQHAAQYRIISEGYFAAMHIALIAGRPFSSSDGEGSTAVAIINETLAHQWWPQQSPLGKFLNVSEELGKQFIDVPRQIIGVAADIHETSLDQPPEPALFIPLLQASDSITAFANKAFLTSIVVRTNNMGALTLQMRSALESADPDLPLASLRPFVEVIEGSVSRSHFYVWLTTIFGVFALLLTVIGIYGLLSYRVSLCAREIGIRMAFGATRRQVVTLVVSRAMYSVSAGLVLGLLGAFFLRTLIRTMVYNAENSGLGVVLNALFVFALTATLASLLPAHRAASIEPMAVLRDE